MNQEIGLCGVSEADHYANVCGCQGGDATHVIKFDRSAPYVEPESNGRCPICASKNCQRPDCGSYY